jgi:ribosome biogenesis protein UTP30
VLFSTPAASSPRLSPSPPATSVCLITKDPQRECKDLLEAASSLSRASSASTSSRASSSRSRPRRQLAADHELFLCDDRVLPMMPKLLGKTFFSAKKQPIPVNLLRKDLKAELGRAINSTYFHP